MEVGVDATAELVALLWVSADKLRDLFLLSVDLPFIS